MVHKLSQWHFANKEVTYVKMSVDKFVRKVLTDKWYPGCKTTFEIALSAGAVEYTDCFYAEG